MKKEYKIGIALLSLFAVIVTTGHSFSMVTKGAEEASFGISQAKTYYLKGSFNEWGAIPEDMLLDVTESMGEEEHKVAEYTITKALTKDAQLKIWDSDNNWYTQGLDDCNYADKWSRTTENEGNYVVPMTATYNIYLKFYDDGSKQVYLTASDITKLYFKPNDNWASSNARFAAYFFNGPADSESVWRDLVENGDYYEVNIPEGYASVIFCRMNPDNLENRWNTGSDTDENKPLWNQTADLYCGPASYTSHYELAEDAPWNNPGENYWRAV